MTDPHDDPRREPSVPARISLAVGSGSLLQPLNSSMIAVALVAIASDLSITHGISWLISGLYLATAVAAPLAGRFADLYGPRRVYLAGLTLIAIGSILGPLTANLPGLVVARVILGLGTATQFPAAFAIIRDRADRHRENATGALAVLNICAQVSVALGPTIGGFLVGFFGWEAIFLVNLPLCLISGVWVWRVTDPDRPRATGGIASVDLVGAALFAATLTALMFWLLSLGEDPQWWWIVPTVAAGAVLVAWERRRATPFLDLSMLGSNPALVLVLVRQMVLSTAFYSIFYVMPQWLERSRGFDPEQAGLLVLPIAAVGVLMTIVGARMIRARGVRLPLVIGSGMLVVSGCLLAFVLDGGTPVWGLVLVAAMLGIPNGFNNQSNQNELNDVTPAAQIGGAAGLLRAAQYIGANLSAALLESLLHGTADDAGLHRVGVAVVVLALVLLAGSLVRLRRAGR